MKYIPGTDFFVYYEVFPWSIHGLVTTNDDGTYSIYLNKRYPLSVLKKTFQHEVKHITDEDFYNGKPIEAVENL